MFSCLSCLLGSIWYLYHTDTIDTPILNQHNESESLHTATHSDSQTSQVNIHTSADKNTEFSKSAHETDLEGEQQFQQQEKLLAIVMENFKEMEQVLENIDHPVVQEFMAALPPESQKSLKMAALKQSVSKRLDIVEANPLSPIDLKNLNKDIDELAKNFVMMPEEARNLKAYLQQRTKS